MSGEETLSVPPGCRCVFGAEWAGGFDCDGCAAHGPAFAALTARLRAAEAKLNTPELHDFAAAVVLESAHQRERWGSEHDAGKSDADWFWLVGYLAGKALHSVTSGNVPKALHHVITTAAALANWHAALNGDSRIMRPGIAEPAHVTGAKNEGKGG